MSNPYYPSQVTRCTKADWLRAMGDAWKRIAGVPATPQALRLLCAHWGLETGFGSQMWCYNIGNARAFPGWTGGVTFLQGNEGSSDWFDFTPSGKNRFRAYPTLQEGIDDYLRLKMHGFPDAFRVLLSTADPLGYAQALHDQKPHGYMKDDAKHYAPGLKNALDGIAGIPIPPAAPVDLTRLEPRGCDPTQDPDYVPELFHPYPAIGSKQWTPPPHCAKCNGLYAVHAGFTGDPATIRPDVLEGYPCIGRRDLSNATIGTVFSGDKLRHYDWKEGKFLEEGKLLRDEFSLEELGLPDEIKSIDAACVNPVDWDVVWLFSGNKVVDFSKSKGRPLRRGRVAGGSIASEVAVEVKDHPVFGALGPDFNDGITSAFLGHHKVSLSAGVTYDKFEAAANAVKASLFPLMNLDRQWDYVAKMPVPKDDALWVFVVSKKAAASLIMTSVDRAWPYASLAQTWPFPGASGRGSTKTINGVGPMGAQIISIVDGPKYKVTRWDPDQVTEEKELFKDWKPDAAVPVALYPPGPVNVAATPSVTSPNAPAPANAPTQPAATVNVSTDAPPDTVIAIPGRGRMPIATDETTIWLFGLQDCNKGAPTLDADLAARNKRLAKWLVDDKDVPDFFRTFVPVRVTKKVLTTDGGKQTMAAYEVVYFVSPDWISYGSDFLWYRVPLSAAAGQTVMDAYGCVYPTALMARQIRDATPTSPVNRVIAFNDKVHAAGAPTSTQAFMEHHKAIEEKRLDRVLGHLLSGAKRDVVVGAKVQSDKKLVLWQGAGAQGRVSTDALEHTEHTMGTRMVCKILFIRRAGDSTWQQKLVEDVLKDPVEYKIISDDPGLSPRYP